MMAGPPYAVAPTFRKPVTISFHAVVGESGIELQLHPPPGGPRLLVDHGRRGHVLQCDTAAVEDDDLVVAPASGPASDDNVRELGVHLVAGHQPRGEGMLQLTDLHTLIEAVDHDRR